MKEFNPRNWYWIVAGDETRAFSSALGNYVPAQDATFLAWQRDGTHPTRIDSEASLGDVLAPHRVRPAHAGVLDGYLERQSLGIVDELQFKVDFNHENRIRAIERALGLNGSPPNLTAAQAKAAVKVLL